MTSPNTRRLGHVADVRPSSVDKTSKDGEEPVRLCNYTDVYYRDTITPDVEFTEATAPEHQRARFELRRDDVLLTKDSETPADIGVSAWVAEDMPGVLLSYHAALVRPKATLNGRFLHYALQSAPVLDYFHQAARGVTRYGLRQDDLSLTPIPWHEPAEQQRIADYLDAETRHISQVIDKNRQMLRLLGERRRSWLAAQFALHASDRDTWWRVKHIAERVTVGIVVEPSKLYVDDGGVPALRGLNVKPGRVTGDDLMHISESGNDANSKSRLRQGDVVAVRTGQAGTAAVVPDWAVGGNCIDLLLVRPGPDLIPKFLEIFLNSHETEDQIRSGTVGAIQGHFNVEALRELRIPKLELGEQKRLVRDVRDFDADQHAVSSRLQSQNELLRERRQALITEAVAGQLDTAQAA